jgi:hypothetical protein
MLDRGAAVHHDRQPGLVSDPRGLPVDHPELEPQAPCAHVDRLPSMRLAQLGATEDIDDVERPGALGGLAERAEGRHAEDVSLIGVDGNALEALVDEVAEDAERGTRGVRRCAHDRDPARRAKEVGDAVVVQERDGAAAFVEVEERGGPGALDRATLGSRTPVLGRQVAPSLTYG